MDDERAYQNALLATYPETKISLCLFHVNKNILKRMAKKKLSNFFRKTQKDEEKWTFGKMKELMALPFLKEDMIVDEFRAIKTSVLDTLAEYMNDMVMSEFGEFFDSIGSYYFENTDKIAMLSKYKQTIRTTNCVESSHSAFNKSVLLNKNGKVSNLIHGNFIYHFIHRSIGILFYRFDAS